MLFIFVWIYSIISMFQNCFMGYSVPDSIGIWIIESIFFILGFVISSGVILGAGFWISYIFDTRPVKGKTQKLAVVGEKDGISGSFCLWMSTLKKETARIR